MPLITVDKEKCKRDGVCIAECPMSLLTKDELGFPKAVENAENMCPSCGHCVAVCPLGGLSLKETQAKDLKPVLKELEISIDQAEQFLKAKRSIRSYKPKSVPHEVLEKLLDCARWAPSASNIQPVHWLVFENPEEVKKLAEMVAEAFKQKNFLPDVVKAWEQGKDMILRGAPHLVIAHAPKEGFDPVIDCAIAITHLDLFANACGLGTCWAGMFMIAARLHSPIMEYLSIPKNHQLCAAMMLGYPKYRYHRIPPRKEAKIIWR
jgi:nitroreductase/NAD-dependent dihydropyrimidine dehydrogenase PreA subunit